MITLSFKDVMLSSESSPLRNSNNFYHKNQSTIFDYGSKIENAIHVAKNQPLPPSQSLNSKTIDNLQTIENIVDDSGTKDVSYLSHHNQAFTISGAFNEDIAMRRESERKKWVEELNAQIKEKQIRKSSEQTSKPNDNEIARNEAFSSPQILNTNHEKEYNNNFGLNRNPLQSSYVRGQNAYVDPVELERRQEVRRKALEQQHFIKAQIEERRKQKMEEERARKLEEEIEMKRIEDEKRRIQEDLEKNAQSQKLKERKKEEEHEQHKKSIETANKAAAELKRQKHQKSKKDSGNMTKSDNVIKSIRKEVGTNSPRKEAIIEINSPRMDDILEGSPSPAQKPSAKLYSSVSTQTISDVSCQTDFAGNLGHLPSETRLIQIPDRELSAIQVETSRKVRKLDKSSKSESNLPRVRNSSLRKSNSNIEDDSSGRKKNAKPENAKPPRKPKPEYQLYDINGKLIRRNPPEQKKYKVQYDSNGRRIRPKENESAKENFFSSSHKYTKNQDVSLVVIKENQPLAEILDDPSSEK